MRRLTMYIPGMSDEHAKIFWDNKIRTHSQLLFALQQHSQRERYSSLFNISQSQLLSYANAADLLRIPGIGYRYIQLLRSVDCNTVLSLSYRNVSNLHAQMYQVNLDEELVLLFPSINLVQRWITRAKLLPKIITYR